MACLRLWGGASLLIIGLDVDSPSAGEGTSELCGRHTRTGGHSAAFVQGQVTIVREFYEEEQQAADRVPAGVTAAREVAGRTEHLPISVGDPEMGTEDGAGQALAPDRRA